LDIAVLGKILVESSNIVVLLGKIQDDDTIPFDLIGGHLRRKLILGLGRVLMATWTLMRVLIVMIGLLMLLIHPRLVATLSLHILLPIMEVILSLPAMMMVVSMLMSALHIHLLMLLGWHWDLNRDWL
jgi:hypothetical protein